MPNIRHARDHEPPMIIEIYLSGTNHPALYDAYMDKDGLLYHMEPPPPMESDDLAQIVVERDWYGITDAQRASINAYLRVHRAEVRLFFHDFMNNIYEDD